MSAQQWKKVDIVARKNYDRVRELLTAREEDVYFPDIGGSDEEKAGTAREQDGPEGQEAAQQL